MLIKTRGIVFHHFKYSETSIIARIYTEKLGLQSFMIRGLKSKKSTLRKSLFQPLHLLNLENYHREKKDLNSIREVQLARHFKSIPFDVRKSTIVLFLKEILNLSIREEEANNQLFEFLFTAIEHLDDREENISTFHLSFLISLSKYLGFSPKSNYLTGKGFLLSEGEFVEASGEAESLVVPEPFSGYINELNRRDLFSIDLQIRQSDRKKLLDFIIMFYRHHIPDMREVKSHKVLQQVLD